MVSKGYQVTLYAPNFTGILFNLPPTAHVSPILPGTHALVSPIPPGTHALVNPIPPGTHALVNPIPPGTPCTCQSDTARNPTHWIQADSLSDTWDAHRAIDCRDRGREDPILQRLLHRSSRNSGRRVKEKRTQAEQLSDGRRFCQGPTLCTQPLAP